MSCDRIEVMMAFRDLIILWFTLDYVKYIIDFIFGYT